MFEVFSTREVALGIYLIAIVLLPFLIRKSRKSAIDLIKCALMTRIAIPFYIMLVYAALITWGLTFFDAWKWIYLKDIILWFIFAGVPFCYKTIDIKDENHYFAKMIRSNITFYAIAELFVNTHTFHIGIELLLQPFIFFLVLMQTVASENKKFTSVKNLIESILALLGIIAIVYNVSMAITSYSDQGFVDYIVAFMIPLVFSVLFVPVAYGLALYVKYENLFMRMSFIKANNKKLFKQRKREVIKACGLSYKKVIRFHNEFLKKIYGRMSDEEFVAVIEEFKNS